MSISQEGIHCNYLNEMDLVWDRPDTFTDTTLHYCPGCGHSVINRLIMESVQELNIEEKTIGVAPVGCSVFAYHYMFIDMQEAAHGRASAVATGIKRILPDRIVFSYQGDGDLAAIGTAETIHTVNRGENILMLFINNGIYGMTGGQMSPTTLKGSITSTSPDGRDYNQHGYPLDITKIIAQMPGSAYVTRQSVDSANAVRKTKKAMMKSLKYQMDGGRGVCFIEIVSNCPSGWKMTPTESNEWLRNEIFNHYELGDIKQLPKLKTNEI
ncbi:MAG: 2-oxoglutarate oxidoreductase [Candidatus Marinimicrobia bacterium]|jgi:2-oxoglutarate ferredoxin oxidoreductase subunit beta|nr:2-oxoglutarate oxidoreductase [Candidatus Neomarinimicrobiota bacterium]MBT3839988.1 2-oxoglutarate oxidoreductase [Candidatus Neomarinimicrobiota bacterium]MBT3999260.1 2-oxoglutarate oxidoreductase [Candidatus Neomarinimicrobiota bacterium]MBT4282181.1 2-oxoglutarate oxidoreductase [Candidatus Neomarinimicrobiota bacterium]MBT4579861.1 2-oxoglutarate oxidoreductase [Candidatus Neomarinimicrobiota bacterium]